MVQGRMYIDKMEIVFLVPAKNKTVRHNLSASDIARVQFDKSVTKTLGFIKSEDETITVVSGKVGAPMIYKKSKNKKHFDEYKRGLEEFARRNNVTFIDNTKGLV